MRNPLKKLQKKINFRLANNAAQHSQATKKTGGIPRLVENSTSSITSQEGDHEDPLFNNRSSQLRLEASQSKEPNNSQEERTQKKKKTRTSKLPFGGSRKNQSIGSPAETSKEKEESEPLSQHAILMTSQRPTKDAPQKPKRINTGSRIVQPTKSSPKRLASTGRLPQKAQPTNTTPKRNGSTGRIKLKDPNLERIAKAAAALDNTGNALFEKGEYDKAMANYVKALKLKNRTLAGAGADAANTNNPLAGPPLPPPNATAGAASPPSAAAPVDPKAKQGADELWISVATSINNIGYLRQQSGQASAEETMQAYQNSLQIKRRVLGKDNLSVGKTLNNLGTVHYLKREYEQALAAYQEALQIMMATLGSRHLDVGTVHSNIGDVFWAQSGDTKPNEKEESYEASRNMALHHYRHSLEIRWEELKDHHDPKVIRLLEKIAALEMGESFLALVQNNHRHRQSPKGGNNPTTQGSPESVARSKADEALEAEHGAALDMEYQSLRHEVHSDVKKMDMMERKLAIDMVKDKLRLIREFKKLSNLTVSYTSDDDDDYSISSELTTPIRVAPLSPLQRREALCAVKLRLQQLRESRIREADQACMLPIHENSDLKEADRSPCNFVLSQRAAQLLNRFQPPLVPPEKVDGLDELRKFTASEPENNPEAGPESNPEAGNSEGDDESLTGFEVGQKAERAMAKGIVALRRISGHEDIPTDGNPWVIASTLTTPPEKKMGSPVLPSASIAC